MEQTRKPGLSISQQADLLLDDTAAIENKRRVELFSSLEEDVLRSLQGVQTIAAPKAPEKPQENYQYIVASRLGRADYDGQAKQEALLAALQKLRSSNRAARNS